MSVVVHTFALFGLLVVFNVMVKPFLWCGLYATGFLIFDIRVARADGRRTPIPVRKAIKRWWAHYKEAMRWPADSVTVGQLSWKPFFRFEGFKGSGPSEGETS